MVPSRRDRTPYLQLQAYNSACTNHKHYTSNLCFHVCSQILERETIYFLRRVLQMVSNPNFPLPKYNYSCIQIFQYFVCLKRLFSSQTTVHTISRSSNALSFNHLLYTLTCFPSNSLFKTSIRAESNSCNSLASD